MTRDGTRSALSSTSRIVDDGSDGPDASLPFDCCGRVGIGSAKVINPRTKSKRWRQGVLGSSPSCPSGPVKIANEKLVLFERDRAGYSGPSDQTLKIRGESSARRIKDRPRQVAQYVAMATAAKNVGGAYVAEVCFKPDARKEIGREAGIHTVQSDPVRLDGPKIQIRVTNAGVDVRSSTGRNRSLRP